MLYGFAPLAAPAPEFGYTAPVTNIWAYKVNGVSGSGVVSAGALEVANLVSNTKSNTLLSVQGDCAYGPVWYGLVNDADWVDTPNYTLAGFQ